MEIALVGAGGDFVIAYFTFVISVEVIELAEFLCGVPMSVAVYDGVIVAGALAVEFVEGEIEGVHGSEDGDGFGECQAVDVEAYGTDIIAVYAIFVGVELGLGVGGGKGEKEEEE